MRSSSESDSEFFVKVKAGPGLGSSAPSPPGANCAGGSAVESDRHADLKGGKGNPNVDARPSAVKTPRSTKREEGSATKCQKLRRGRTGLESEFPGLVPEAKRQRKATANDAAKDAAAEGATKDPAEGAAAEGAAEDAAGGGS